MKQLLLLSHFPVLTRKLWLLAKHNRKSRTFIFLKSKTFSFTAKHGRGHHDNQTYVHMLYLILNLCAHALSNSECIAR